MFTVFYDRPPKFAMKIFAATTWPSIPLNRPFGIDAVPVPVYTTSIIDTPRSL